MSLSENLADHVPPYLRDPHETQPATARILSHRLVIERDEINPDSLIDSFAMAISALEHHAEVNGVACDWETIKLQLATTHPALSQRTPRVALIMADVATLS